MFNIETLRSKSDSDLAKITNDLGVKTAKNSTDNDKIFAILDFQASNTKVVKDYFNATETPMNTEETNVQLQKVVDNQNAYIDILKEQLATQKKQMELNEEQLGILNNIFASSEDGVIVEKEIMKLIQDQIDSSHPLWDYVKDKGGDIAVVGATAGAPVVYASIKMFLASKGIMLP